jgi:hypothetical protein
MRDFIMSINCDVILHWSVTPPQLTALGTALWRWCNHTAGDTGIYRRLDNQALADLIAGRLPASYDAPRQAGRWRMHFWVRDEASQDRLATVESLRRDMPTQGIEDIVVDGTSWNSVKQKDDVHTPVEIALGERSALSSSSGRVVCASNCAEAPGR